MSTNTATIWTRAEGTRRKKEHVLVARQISDEWLEGSVNLSKVYFAGELLRDFRDLLSVAKDNNLNVPVVSLRTALMGKIEGLLSVDRDLGANPFLDTADIKPAIKVFSPDEEDKLALRTTLVMVVRNWVRDVLEIWAEKHGLGHLVERLIGSLIADNIEISDEPTSYLGSNGLPNYPLIARSIGDLLIGEELFEGLKGCELVTNPGAPSNTIELMTLPQRGPARGKESAMFSMAARISVVSVPYVEGLFLSVSAVKRVWAKRMPKGYTTSSRATAYVVAEGRPVTPVSVRKRVDGWEFGEEYLALIRESGDKLPDTLEKAITQQEYNDETGWWAGLPELPILFRSIAPRTVLEGDEVDLMVAIYRAISPVVTERPIQLNEIKLPSFKGGSRQEMLKLSDFGMAGSIFNEDDEDGSDSGEGDGDSDELSPTQQRIEKLDRYRKQNIEALKLTHGNRMPVVWMLGGSEEEQTLAEKTARTLFGDTIEFNKEALPDDTHGLKQNLPCRDGVARERFDARLKSWNKTTNVIKKASGDKHAIVLICAPDREGTKPEDPVNFYAGIHATSLIGANVHHVLPIEKSGDVRSTQDFLYRVQSALLDVMLAHTGVVLGVKEYVNRILPQERIPDAVYGIQVIRSRAQVFSGQKQANFILYSRLVIETGKTEVRISYSQGKKNRTTDWMPLEQGLIWIGCNRKLSDIPVKWLENNFADMTLELLVQINEEDPRAVILIDWQSVRSLWRGISDRDLSGENGPSLKTSTIIPLSRFRDMTFIRLRHGRDTMTLRSMVTNTFKRWADKRWSGDGSSADITGETTSDQYASTFKSMVELATASQNDGSNYGHFINSMGYLKTVQTLRGLSGYRTTQRITKLGGKSGAYANDDRFFEMKTMEVFTKDASLPASMDVTVLHAPKGVPPKYFAALAMGLRLGFAHYDQWTKLPAPLFFRKKVDDYIIRYIEESVDKEALESDVITTSTVLSDLVVDDISGNEEVSEQPDSDSELELAEERVPVGDGAEKDLLRFAKGTPFPFIVDHKNDRVYQIRAGMFNGDHQVTVELPSWITLPGILVSMQPVTKHNVRKSWRWLKQIGFVKSGIRMPRPNEYLDWLGQKLRTPQVCYTLSSSANAFGPIAFKALADIIKTEYNTAVDEESAISPFSLGVDNVVELTRWAVEREHDELLGWLLFLMAQMPIPEVDKKFISLIPSILGPRTQEALSYYIETSKVIDSLIHDKTLKKPIRISREIASPNLKTEVDDDSLAHSGLNPKRRDQVRSSEKQGDCLFVNNRKTLVQLVDSLNPGSKSFDETLTQIEEKITALTEIHQERQKAQAAVALSEKLDLFYGRQGELERRINEVRDDIGIDGVSSRKVSEVELDTASKELENIAESIDKLSGLLDKLYEIQSQRPRGIAAIRAQSEEQTKTTDSVVAQVDSICSLLEEGICFDVIKQESLPDSQEKSAANDDKSDVFEILGPEPDSQTIDVAEGRRASVEGPIEDHTDDSSDGPAITADIEEITTAKVSKTLADSGSYIGEVNGSGIAEEVFESEEFVEEENKEDNVSIGPDALASQIGTLQTLLDRRLYGLAEVHTAAIARLLYEVDDPELCAHKAILSAIVHSLEKIDCQSSFETRLHNELKVILKSEKLPSGQLSDPEHMALGILAAGLPNMMFNITEDQWLIKSAVSTRLTNLPAVSALLEHLDLIRQRGYILTRDMFSRSRIGDEMARQIELDRFKKRAQNWRNDSELHVTFNSRGYKAAHSEMFSANNPIGKCISLIASGHPGKALEAYTEAKRKFEKPKGTVLELFKQLGERSKPEGLYRTLMLENIETTHRFMKSYINLIDSKKKEEQQNKHDIQQFLVLLSQKLVSAKEEVENMAFDEGLENLYRQAAIKSLGCAIGLFEPNDTKDACIPGDKQKLLVQLPMGKDMMPMMQRLDVMTPPLSSPNDVFQQTRSLANEQPLAIGEVHSEDNIDNVLVEAYHDHLREKRFLPAHLIEKMLDRGIPTKGRTLIQQHDHELTSLVSELQEARQKVAHAMTLDALPEEQESYRMQRVIEDLLILSQNERTVGTPEVGSLNYLDFPQARAVLRSNVLQPLDIRLQNAKQELEMQLNEEEATGLRSAADINRIRKMFESNNAASLRTANDALVMLRQSGKLPAKISTSTSISNEYDDAIQALVEATGCRKQLLPALKMKLESPIDLGADPDWLVNLDEDQRADAVSLIEVWEGFFNERKVTDQTLTERFFSAMGVMITPSNYPESGRENRARLLVDTDTFLFPTSAEDSVFIPPILGSWAQHTLCYALWGTTQDNEIRQLVQQIGSTPALILFRANLDMERRAKVSGAAPVLLVDDNMVAYMAINPPNERLQTLFKVGMQTFTTNPYDDYGSKPVPTEMFFGRQGEKDRLRNVKGLAVLYGGRRLGKSSLLNEIEWDSRNIPGMDAVYISMETIDTTDHVKSAWEFIRRALESRDLITPLKDPIRDWIGIVDHIRNGLKSNEKVKSLYLLIDEANDLMGCELKLKREEISFVRSLTQLQDDVKRDCNIRMAIAGLHNMTRMANDENSVFGKADPIALKPFSTADDVHRGLRLITKPLEAMGYYFGGSDLDLPLRILSVCNFYPAFIQLYCKRLVERLQNNRQEKRPPIFIKEEDLEAVEKDNSLLSELREKFKLNLNLDKRYKAIALILADVYYSEIETGQNHGLTMTQIREYCETYCPTHFEDTGPGVYEALLDEMSKLNVVEKVGSRYVLRNPNIAQLVGERDRVTTLLSELDSEPPEASRNQGERRVIMTKGDRYVTFPMPVSWIRNRMEKNDGTELIILTGNQFSGVMDLAMVDREGWELQNEVYHPVLGAGPQSLNTQLTKIRRNRGKMPKMMVVRHNGWQVKQIPEYAAIANKAGKIGKSGGIRIILLAHPERAYEIVKQGKLCDQDTNHPWCVVPIPPWSQDAIYYWIHENAEVAESQKAIAAIKDASCGFGKLVGNVCNSNLTVEGALKAPVKMRKVIAPNLVTFYEKIGMPRILIEEKGEEIKEFLAMINGVDRNNVEEFEESAAMYNIDEDLFQFLYWMGLVQEGTGGKWSIPGMYANLIGAEREGNGSH